MNWEEWSRYDAIGLAELVRKKHATPRELACQAAAGIAKVNPSINAVIEVFEDVVDQPVKDGMNPEGLFAGVPCLIKDLGPTLKGRKQEMGSFLMQGNIAPNDSFLTTKMRKAGLNIIGRAATSEFGLSDSAENPAVYISRNPWNIDYVTGGSSVGSGPIVASGAIPISHASDGGGSTRVPAGINGGIGFKPSRGVFSAAPQGSDLTALTSANGCISRSVRDIAGFIDACRGGAAGEFTPYWLPAQPYLEQIKRDPPKLKIAISHEWGEFRATPHIASELQRAGRFLEQLGHHVEWCTPGVDFRAFYSVSTANSMTRTSRLLNRLLKLKGHVRPSVPMVEPVTAKIWEAGIERRSDAQEQIPVIYNQISRTLGEFFESWDVILTPIMTMPTHKLGTDFTTMNDKISADEWFFNSWRLYPYAVMANICGSPGVSVPIAMDENGLPLGVHAFTRQAEDGLLLQLSAQIERALNCKWNQNQRPQIHVTNL
ncbi:amidase [Bradyrhizobium sp. UFLA 03-164]|uniref:Amidase n=2 Tax=Bradyrhizobium uaiense TaxID=2594946 RepID=A0A6P1BV10_9BRAD|nr:amidase [Bradyrhizobium uaiense]